MPNPDSMSALRSLDIFDKFENEDYAVQSEIGRSMSSVFMFYAVILFLEQLLFALLPRYHKDLNVDVSLLESIVNISLSIHVRQPCRYLQIEASDKLGFNYHDLDKTIQFRRTFMNGTEFGIYNISRETACGDCYGFRPNSTCCNTCESLMLFAKLNGTQPTPEKWIQCQEHELVEDEVCLIKGKIAVNRVPGFITIGTNPATTFQLPKNMLQLSHFIERVRFGPKVPFSSQPLTNFRSLALPGMFSSFTYTLMATPIFHEVNNQLLEKSFEYTCIKTSGMHRDNPNITIKYGFSPYGIKVTGYRKPFLQFITSTLGLLSGGYTILNLVQSVVQNRLSKNESDESTVE